jgi:hypothetical protein
VSAQLNVLIATGKIVTRCVINVNRDYRCPAPLPTSGRSRRAFADTPSAGAPSRPCSGSGKLRLKCRRPRRRAPALAAARAVLFLEKVSPSLEPVDGSSGAIGAAVNHAIEACAKIISEVLADERTRDQWLDRLWETHLNDEVPYIERPDGLMAQTMDAGAMVSKRRLIGLKYSTGHAMIDGNCCPRTISQPLRT